MRLTLTLFALAAGLSLQAQNVSITQIQSTTDPSGDSPYNGQTVQTTGVVTASAEEGNLGYVFIQEEGVTEWGAIQLFGHPNLGDLKIGDRIGVQGTVQESFGFTVLNQIAGIEVVDSNVAIYPFVLNPNFFTNAPFSEIEKYESMYVQLQIGQDSVYVVDPNVSFGDYRIGADTSDSASGCLVLAGRQDGSNTSSLNVSYVSDSIYATNSGTMLVPVIEVQTGDAFTSVRGIITYAFSNYRLIPRNNADFGDVSTGFFEMGMQKLLVYPNPSEGFVRIQNVNSGTIRMMNAAGQVVHESSIKSSNNSDLDLNHLAKGVYLMVLSTREKTYNQKIIIQ